MRSPLHSRIAALRGRVRRLLALHGLSLVVAGAAVFILLAGLADWSIHLARELRLILLVGLVALVGYLFARYVIAPLVIRFRDLDIALKIERRWPGLNDRLASTVQFLDMADAGDGDRNDVLGSRAMRDATVRQTLAETEAIDFREVIDPRPARRATLLALGAVALGVSVAALDPRIAGLAMDRLFFPLRNTQWPKMTHLSIANAPKKVAKGEPFAVEVAVAEGERAPSTARITYRFSDGETSTESLRPDDRNRFHGRKEAVDRSFTFSVAAGDDATDSRAVEVVPPPVISTVSVTLTPPAYTRLSPQALAPGKYQIQGVRGTRGRVDAVANKPLASATLPRGEGQKAVKAEVSPSDPTRISAEFDLDDSGPVSFALKDTEGFRSQEKDAVRFDLRSFKDEAPKVVIDEPANDRDVTANADIPVQITADDDFGLGSIRLVYKVSVGGSEPGKEVVVPLWTLDESAPLAPKNRQANYLWKLADLGLPPVPGSVITLFADSRDLFRDARDASKPPLGPNVGKSREIHLRIVTPDEILRQLEAIRRALLDDIDRTLAMQKQAQQPVQDAMRTLDRTEKLDAPRREDVKNAETIQRQVSNRVASKVDGLEQKIAKSLEDMKNLKIDSPDVQGQMEKLLKSVESIRDNNLGPAEQGLTRATKEADADADADADRENRDPGADAKPQNASPSPSDKAKTDRVVGKETSPPSKSGDSSKADARDANEASELGESSKADAKSGDASKSDAKSGESSKAEASKSGSESSKSDQAKGQTPKSGEASKSGESKPQNGKPSPVKDALAQADKNQKAIADELQKMRDALGEFETYKGVVQDAKKLLKEQEDAMKAAAEAASKPDLTGKAPDALTPQQKADLANTAARQAEVARNLAALENKMSEMAGKLEASDPLAASSLKEAVQQSRERGTSGKMDEAAKGIEENKMGQAQSGQKQAQQDLKKLVSGLENRRENELARLVKELKQAEKEMQNLRDKQKNNREQTGKAKAEPNAQAKAEALQKLSKEQKELQAELKKQLLKLQKLRAEAAAQAGQKASGKMAQAGQEQEEGDADEAEKQQEEALANLEEAQDEIEQARKDAEDQLAMEQLSKIKDNLQGLLERQEKTTEETVAYEKARTEKGLSLAQRASIRTLGRVQDSLKDEAAELTDRLDSAPAFALTLKKATTQMGEAAQRLQSLKTDDPTQKAEMIASKRIKGLLDALKPDSGPNGPQQPPPGGGGGGGGGGQKGSGDRITLAAQLKVLKGLQEEINERTEALDELRTRKKELSPDQQSELERLGDDQRTIADLARDLTKPKKADGED